MTGAFWKTRVCYQKTVVLLTKPLGKRVKPRSFTVYLEGKLQWSFVRFVCRCALRKFYVGFMFLTMNFKAQVLIS